MIEGFNEYGRLKWVAMRRPQEAMIDDRKIDAEWRDLNYHSRPDLALARDEHARFAELLTGIGAQILYLPGDPALTLDSLYVRDAAIVAPGGIVLCHMGKRQREAEPEIHGRALAASGVKVLGRILPPGRLEGGDLVWLDERHVVIGRTYRTNEAGIDQFRALIDPGIEIEVSALPHFKGESDVFHLMSILSPLDRDLALVYSPLMPIPLRESLKRRGIALVEVPESEFLSMGCNVLAIAPREVVMVKGNPETRNRLLAAGCRVHVLAAEAISVPGEGGPTCLTRPLSRA